MAFFDSLDLTFNELVVRGFTALGIIILGILLGQLLDYLLRKLSDKVNIKKHIKGGFIDLTLFIIRWSVYIVFINLGLHQLQIPAITDYFSSILTAIPAFTGGLLLLILGFAFAFYLKKIIKISEEGPGWEFISQAVFFFVLIIFAVYALRIALVLLDDFTRNIILIILTTICSAGAVYYFVNRELKNHKA
jgi:hypothetical protein